VAIFQNRPPSPLSDAHSGNQKRGQRDDGIKQGFHAFPFYLGFSFGWGGS
jgi:hypothetical protein